MNDSNSPEISQDSLRALMQAGARVVVVDVRSPEEFAAGHVEGARNIPIEQLQARVAELPADVQIVTTCTAGGGRSHRAAAQLRELGHAATIALQGGTRAWLERDARSSESTPIYLDHNATTPVAPEVVEAMLPFLRGDFGNPSSAHKYGLSAARAMASARGEVAALLNADADEVLFTSCATEANNLALLGVAAALEGSKRHLVVSSIEHPSVQGPAKALEARGWEVTSLPVDSYGRVAPDELRRALRADTALVSVMHANNEVGTVQPISELARLAHERGALMHTDAAQSAGKLPLDVRALGVDLLTLAGHKFNAPKGVGALYIRRGTQLVPLMYGAGQEHGLRSGTENVALVVGLGTAAHLAGARLPEHGAHLAALRDRLHAKLVEGVPGLLLNGHPQERLPSTLHVSFPGVSGRALLEAAHAEVAASVGSACHSFDDSVSGVLAAMGADASRAAGAVRLSLGTSTTETDVDRAAQALISVWRRLPQIGIK